ncbi:putative aldouronate transport system substrate-binding protein [Paenibacillus sp. UNCCL117]|uniref:extracellular solute-binding protein n=1 Tax=unclassified Paenibacillus TaxID=185978 RepID=UPI00087DFE4A|nr:MULTISPECIES: extracellular solute-binding protein [unclassified Paenibacillus]SDC54884.1 putative aldouronate transport system substrate-binding protein [Paenibacillus sp. cl123]SFW10996.1 putative aldouronate transport system substrate-binding protein [Paenibacillus sp. UNCCL117]
MLHELKRAALPLLAAGALAAVTASCSASPGYTRNENAPQASEREQITVTVYDRGNVPSSEGTIENNKITKWINETADVEARFVAVPRSQAEQKLNALFASGEGPDLMMEYAPQIKNTLIDRKMVRPIDDMIERYSTTYKQLLAKYPALRKAGTGSDGKLYQFGRINETIPTRGFFIRADWLKKLHLAVPTTTEELYEVAKAFTEQDPDGNGINDTYGIALSGSSGYVLSEMFGVTYPNFVVQDGELVHGWDHIEALTAFKRKLYSEGLVDPNFLSDKNGARAKKDFLNNRIGMFMDQFNVPMTFYTDTYVPLKRNVPSAELAVIPYPATPVGRFNSIFVNPIQMTAVVNAETKHPEAVMKYVDFASSEKFMKTMYYGFEGVHSKTEPGKCPVMTDLGKWMTEFNYAIGDFAMLASPILAGNCYYAAEKLDSRDPLQQDVKNMFELNSAYVDFSLPIAGPTNSEQLPQLPKELQTILTGTRNQVDVDAGDIWIKAIVTPDYTPEQAKRDAIAAWEKAGGKQVDDWYRNFYAHDRHSIILTQDIYEMFKEQRAAQGK